MSIVVKESHARVPVLALRAVNAPLDPLATLRGAQDFATLWSTSNASAMKQLGFADWKSPWLPRGAMAQ